MKPLHALVAAFLLASSSLGYAVDARYLQGLDDTHYHQFESKEVGRSFHIYTKLPEGYDAAADIEYPTIYLLDGGNLFPMLATYYGYLNHGEEIPDAIIVGISYGSDMVAGGNYRSTDYTAKSEERGYYGGAGVFQSFLSEELLPYVEQNYRANPDRRIVFGQSIGGQFVLYTALTKPKLFWGHIASNPALHRNLSFFLQSHSSAEASVATSKVFVGSGTKDDPRYRIPAIKWIEHWTKKSNKPWALEAMDLMGHSHMSAPPATFRRGMMWLFADS